MYSFILIIHSWLRYPVLLAGLALMVLASGGARGHSGASQKLERSHIIFLSLLDSQMALGLMLYFWLSPITTAAMGDPGAALKIPELRFFGIEHIGTMAVAVTAAHIGRTRSKRVSGRARGRVVFGMQVLWLVLTLLAIPWPELYVTRPLFRF